MKNIVEYLFENKTREYSNIILISDNHEILILRRANYMKNFGGLWGFPGGTVNEKDKNSKETAIRELKEETGIELSWNEKHKCSLYKTIKNKDNSISYYYLVKLETNIKDIKLSKEHSKYDWFNIDNKKNYKWMPDIFQIIQKIYNEYE